MNEESYQELLKENKKLQKRCKDKQETINALVEHLQIKYEYTNRHIGNIIETYRNKLTQFGQKKDRR